MEWGCRGCGRSDVFCWGGCCCCCCWWWWGCSPLLWWVPKKRKRMVAASGGGRCRLSKTIHGVVSSFSPVFPVFPFSPFFLFLLLLLLLCSFRQQYLAFDLIVGVVVIDGVTNRVVRHGLLLTVHDDEGRHRIRSCESRFCLLFALCSLEKWNAKIKSSDGTLSHDKLDTSLVSNI